MEHGLQVRIAGEDKTRGRSVPHSGAEGGVNAPIMLPAAVKKQGEEECEGGSQVSLFCWRKKKNSGTENQEIAVKDLFHCSSVNSD